MLIVVTILIVIDFGRPIDHICSDDFEKPEQSSGEHPFGVSRLVYQPISVNLW
jgi:hypothetical protein